MSSMMCIPCGVEFPSDAFYMVHKKSGHKTLDQATALESLPLPTLPPGVPAESLPNAEFIEAMNRIESKEKPTETNSKSSQHPSELPKAQPLQLTYSWIGEHEKCRKQPSTLKLEVGGKSFSVAYCDSCKEQLRSREVESL